MDSNNIAFITFILYFFLYFFVTQKLYNSKYFFILDTLLLSAPFIFSYYYLNDYRQDRLQKFVFILSYYGLVLMIIKLLYKNLNQAFIKIKWLNNTYDGKNYTFVIHANRSGKPVWDQEASTSPSWLDFLCSYVLLFLPMIFILLTINFILS